MFSVGNSCPNHFKINRAIGTDVPLRGRPRGVCNTPLQPAGRHVFYSYTYPAKFPGLGEALIFFCFFSCIKTRKEDYEGKKKTPILGIDHSFPTENTRGAYAIRPYAGTSNLFFHPYLYPANFLGLGEALIFFCLFSCIKTRPLPGQGSFSRYIFKTDHVSG